MGLANGVLLRKLTGNKPLRQHGEIATTTAAHGGGALPAGALAAPVGPE